MKIAYFTDGFLPMIGGIATHIADISTLLAKEGHHISIFTPESSKKKDFTWKKKNISVHQIPSIPAFIYPELTMPWPIPFWMIPIYAALRKFRPDIIHFHSPSFLGGVGIYFAKEMRIPLVGTFHTYHMETEYLQLIGLDKVGLDKNKYIVRVGWKYHTFFYNQADRVIVPSEFTKSDLLKHGIKKPIDVISNGIDLDKIQHLPANKEIKYNGLPQKYLLYTGRVSKEKSLDITIKAFAQFAKTNDEVCLVIVGDGPAKKELETLSRSLHLNERVYFLGEIAHEQLLRSNIIKNAIAFITNSKSETQCLSMLEALAFGLPVIGVKARALPLLIKRNGILCKVDDPKQTADAMSEMVNHPEKRKQYRVESLRIAGQHSLHETTSKLLKVYKSLIA